MVQILVFANNEPVRVLRVHSHKSKISYLYSDKAVRKLNVRMFFSTFLNGKSSVVLVATDRCVSREEILEAHDTLIE